MKTKLLIIAAGVLCLIILLLVRSCDDSGRRFQEEYTRSLEQKKKGAEEDLIKTWGPNYKKRIDSAYAVQQATKQKKLQRDLIKKYGKKVYNLFMKHPDWSLEDCQAVSKGQIWIGMRYDMLLYMWGRPDHVNVSNYGTGDQYQACWEGYTPSCFYFGTDQVIRSYN